MSLSSMWDKGFKLVERDGITAAVISNNKILLIRRRNMPFLMSHPNMWLLVSGAKERNETHLDAAYREIEEELGIGKQHLKLIGFIKNILLIEDRWRKMWYNDFYVFRSDTNVIRFGGMENKEYRWVTLTEFKGYDDPKRAEADYDRIIELIHKVLLRR